MLRCSSRCVTVQRYPLSVRYSDWRFSARFVSSVPESNESNSATQRTPSSSLSQPALHRKVRIDLRPGPIKPKNTTLSSTHVPDKPSAPSPPAPSAPSLSTAKEASRRDIEEAEAHGILTPPPSGANWFTKLAHKGIQLAKFYYRGVKLIVIRRKEVAIIKARVKAGGQPFTRSEYRFIIAQGDDIRKVIPFVVIALLLEEVIPLIAIYVPSLLPSTCVLPSQRARIEESKTEKAVSFSTLYKSTFVQLRKLENPPGYLPLDLIRQSPAPEAICGILRLSTFGIDALRVRRIHQRLSFIAEDDRLLLRDQPSLSERDLNEALEERGILIQGLSLKAKRSLLEWWLESVKDTNVEASLPRRLLLVLSRH
ncbi:hypothetical protein APHAL10511_000083 [Amanita phalloides]|nr:hypothetical protein APHAL10511_000083 [Amanita phalloides]